MARGNTYGIPLVITANTAGATKANKSLKSLIKNTKSFGLTSKLSIGAASIALTAYAKKSVSAALAEEKAQKSLAQTLKNLGLAYQTVGASKFIDNLQRATGVSEDELRPAFQKLVLVLGDVGKAQSALGLAMDISAGTGKDLSAVSMALAKGYSGQTTALSRLGAGLSKTLLKSGDMEAITAQLSKLFQGQAFIAAKTYSGQMAILGVSAQEASETIGTSLIDALIRLGDNKGIDSAAKSMENFAAQVGFAITGFAVMADKIAANPLFKLFDLLILYPLRSPFTLATEVGKSEVAKGITQTNRQSPRATERSALMAAEKLNKTKKITVDLNKKISATEKLKAMFDIDAVQIAAALKGNISELDRKSLLAMQALKTEDKNDDITALKEVEQAKISADAADRSRKISALQDTISINKLALADVESTLAKITKLPVPIVTYAGGLFAGTSLAPVGTNAGTQAPIAPSMPVMPSTNAGGATAPDLSGYSATELKQGLLGPTTVNMTFNAGVISEEAKLARIMQAALQEANRNGWSTTGLAS